LELSLERLINVLDDWNHPSKVTIAGLPDIARGWRDGAYSGLFCPIFSTRKNYNPRRNPKVTTPKQLLPFNSQYIQQEWYRIAAD
jgi:hypothetical protein